MQPTYRAMKARELLRLLERAPLSYQIVRQTGSHRRLEAAGRPPLTFAFHDAQELPPGLVRKILQRDVGLTDDEIAVLLN